MATRDHWSALGLAGLAIAYLAVGRAYPLDTLATPGPGIFPLATGLALLVLAAWMFAAAGRASAGPADEAATAPRAPQAVGAVLVLYAAAVPALGFILASFALVVVTARLMGLGGWWRPLALGAGVAAATRLIFVTWLGVPLP